MFVIFRTDASLEIGSGHVMRCLTLADALRAHGARCHFICRTHPGNLVDTIQARGFSVDCLAPRPSAQRSVEEEDEPLTAHASWLGSAQYDDAAETRSLLAALRPDWLVVDHYALDSRWERVVRASCGRLMVLDDLADRAHDCDLLLDQGLGREQEDYRGLVPVTCEILAGTRYALLRPEFASLREYSLDRRQRFRLDRILVSMGGVDRDNVTERVLRALRHSALPPHCEITVVMGAHAPWVNDVEKEAALMGTSCHVRINVNNMAELMADSDLAIGAAGSSSWERCALGLPTIMVVLAANQVRAARSLTKEGAATVVQQQQISGGITAAIDALNGDQLMEQSRRAALLVDGLGSSRVISFLMEGLAR